MIDLNAIYDNLVKSREQVRDLLKQKKYFSQAEYEEIKAEAERIKQKYIRLNEEVNDDIKQVGKQAMKDADVLFNGGFVSIEQFANDVSNTLTNSTQTLWEIVAIAFMYKKRTKTDMGLKLIPTNANLIAVAKKNAFDLELTRSIFQDKNWLNNNSAMFGFWELVKNGDVVLLHIVEEENKSERFLNLFENAFNSDFDKYLLRFELDYNECNPVHKYPVLYNYLDNLVFEQLAKKYRVSKK